MAKIIKTKKSPAGRTFAFVEVDALQRSDADLDQMRVDWDRKVEDGSYDDLIVDHQRVVGGEIYSSFVAVVLCEGTYEISGVYNEVEKLEEVKVPYICEFPLRERKEGEPLKASGYYMDAPITSGAQNFYQFGRTTRSRNLDGIMGSKKQA